jgi:hypothetical protein
MKLTLFIMLKGSSMEIRNNSSIENLNFMSWIILKEPCITMNTYLTILQKKTIISTNETDQMVEMHLVGGIERCKDWVQKVE